MKTSLYALLVALLFVASCNGAKQAEPSFSLRLEPQVLELLIGEAGSLTVNLSRSGGFAAPVTVTLDGATAGLSYHPITLGAAESEGILTLVAQDGAALGTSFPLVVATGGGLTRTETLTLRVSAPKAEVTDVVIAGNEGSRQVRQGSGSVRVTVTGRHLKRVTAVSLDELALTFTASEDGDQLHLEVAVPHGAPLGDKALRLTTAGEETTVPEALVVTPITAGPAGDDVTGKGTFERPYRSLGVALAVWREGDTVYLLDGRYSAADGEAWPASVPAGAILVGESMAGAVLEGAGGDSAGLVLAGDASVSQLTLRGFAQGVVANTGAVVLQSARVVESGDGVVAHGNVTLSLRASELAGNTNGLVASAGAVVTLEDVAVHGNAAVGIRLSQAPKVTLRRVQVHGNQTGIRAADDAALTLVESAIYAHTDSGLIASGSTFVSLQASEVHSNVPFGLVFGGEALTLRGSRVYANTEGGAGLYIEGDPSVIDLGTLSEAGLNELYDNTGVQLLDARPDREEPNLAFITLSETRLQGVMPEPGAYLAEGGPYFNEPYFSILGVGNGIRIY